MKLLIVFGIAYAAVCVHGCEKGWQAFNDHCYNVVTEPKLSFNLAQAHCVAKDAYLVVIDSWLENTFVADWWAYKRDENSDLRNAWIGYTDEPKEGDWKWMSGTVGSFTKFYKGEPNDAGNQDCAVMGLYPSGQWDDTQCDNELSFICEK